MILDRRPARGPPPDLRNWNLVVGKKLPIVMTTKLSKLQRRIVRLLGMRMVYDN